MRAGIDPEGGTSPTACSVLWVTTTTEEAYVAFTMPEVTVGRAGRATVFMWGEPQQPYLYNAAYAGVLSFLPAALGAAPATRWAAGVAGQADSTSVCGAHASAKAADLTDHIWFVGELLAFPVGQ
jgi:hypothetical protein